jgi:hypothetical protein
VTPTGWTGSRKIFKIKKKENQGDGVDGSRPPPPSPRHSFLDSSLLRALRVLRG